MLASQIGVVPREPILARRREDVHVVGVFQGQRAVRHVGRNHHHLAGAQHDGLAVDLELQRAADDEGDLLVVVMVLRDTSALLQLHARHHGAVAGDHFAADGGAQLIHRHFVPGVDFHELLLCVQVPC